MTETCKINDLLPNPYNREVDSKKVAHIKAEIQRTGEVYPIVYSQVDNDGKPGKMITDGHHRFHALKELGHTEVPVVLSDERGLKTKAPKEEVTKMAKGLAKAWFGDPERHAEVARHNRVSTAESKTSTHEGLKTAVKIAAVAALTVGGVAALRSPTVRGLIASKAEQFLGRKSASKLGVSTAEATLANGGHTVALSGAVPNARYMVSPYKANEKILPVSQFKAHSVDAYTKQNADLLAKPNHHLGTWHNKETGNVHLDVSLPHGNRLAALETGQKHGQLAIYDRAAGRDIPVNPETIAQAKFVETVRGAHSAAPHSWDPHMSREGGFGSDTLQELSHAVKTGQSDKPIRLLYNAKNGNFIVAPFESSHELMLSRVPEATGELDRHWARMVYHPEQVATGKAGKLELWDWSTAMDEAKGTASRNYADTAESVMRNKSFSDTTRFSIHEPFKHPGGGDALSGNEKTIGEWRQLYGKSSKGMITYDIDSLMKNSKSEIPNRTAMAAEEQAEHPSLPAPVIAQIVQDHLKVGKDIIYKRALALAVSKSLAKSFKPKAEVADEKSEVSKPSEDTDNAADTVESELEQDDQSMTKPETSSVNREVPSEESAQPNTQESIEQASTIDDTLVALHGALQELEMVARDQQMMSEDEMQLIIIPLQEKVSLLLNTLKGGILGESEEVSQEPIEETSDEEATDVEEDTQEEETPVDDSEEKQRTRKKPQGPARKPGTDTAARELTEPAPDFVGKMESNADLHKGFFGIGSGRGWKGDPTGHAEAARERWAMEGVPVGGAHKPAGAPRATGGKIPVAAPQRTLSENALVLPKAVKDVAVNTARRAGRTLARNAGDAIAEIGWQAFGTVAGIVLYRYLAGKSVNPAALGALGVKSLKTTIAGALKMNRVANAVRALKMERTLQTWTAAGKVASEVAPAVAVAGKAAVGAAKVSSKVVRAARAAGKAAKTAAQFKPKPKV